MTREEAIKTLRELWRETNDHWYEETYSMAIEALKQLSSTDAVEIVRCKDCKHRDPEDKKCDFGHDIIWQLPRRDDWYCADGE